MRFLVLSHKHRLLPFAWRLKRNGHEVQVAQVNAKEAYQRAWEGRFECFLQGVDRVRESASAQVREAAEEADAVVLTDSTRWTATFAGYPKLYGVAAEGEGFGLWVVGWFDGARVVAPGLVIEDLGAWSGGQGPLVVGAATLVRLPEGSPWLEPLLAEEDHLKSLEFRGLVSVRVELEPREWVVTKRSMHLGWRPMHTHLWASEVEDLAEVLAGAEPTLPKRFVVAAVVSIPPWPNRPAEPVPSLPIQVLGPDPNAVTREVFFHDMRVEGNAIYTVGLDGLVGVVRGAGSTLGHAQGLVRGRCAALRVAGAQWRVDAGQSAAGFIALSEMAGHVDEILC